MASLGILSAVQVSLSQKGLIRGIAKREIKMIGVVYLGKEMNKRRLAQPKPVRSFWFSSCLILSLSYLIHEKCMK